MLDELLKEIAELREYKNKYESAMKEKQAMSNMIYGYMMTEYEGLSKEDRILKYKKEFCANCRYGKYCGYKFPDDICKPIPSNNAWIPEIVVCDDMYRCFVHDRRVKEMLNGLRE